MTTALQTIQDDVYGLREAFQAVAVTPNVNFDKEAGFAMQIIGANDYMMSCAMADRQAVCNAVTNVAAIGISLNPAKKQAYLVPRKRKIGDKWTPSICLDISYMGLIDLAVDTGSIMWAQANIVREADEFILQGLDHAPVHRHDPFAGAVARGAIRGAYVVVKTHDGGYLTHTMDIEAIYAVRNRSDAWKSGKPCPWHTDEAEMIKKTVVKQAYKYWPKTERSGRVDEAIQMLNTDGEGIDFSGNKTDNQGKGRRFDAARLGELIAGLNGCETLPELNSAWKAGGQEIKPSSDVDAYEKFKAAMLSKGEKLKAAEVVDVVPRMAEGASESVAHGDAS